LAKFYGHKNARFFNTKFLCKFNDFIIKNLFIIQCHSHIFSFIVDIDSLNYDLIGIGLEEIVDLNASNLVKASTTNQRIWCSGIKRIIDEFQREHFGEKAENFVVLCCEQLVNFMDHFFGHISWKEVTNSGRRYAI
jgi:hypothetical protein